MDHDGAVEFERWLSGRSALSTSDRAELVHQFLVVFARGQERRTFPSVGAIREEGIVNLPFSHEAHEKAEGSFFRLVDAGDARIGFGGFGRTGSWPRPGRADTGFLFF